jgi:hypothetical protein
MKSIFTVTALLVGTAFVTPTSAQAPASNEEHQLIALIRDVKAQQTQVLGNQSKIEEKLAEIAETLRVARVFTGQSH